MLKAARDKIKKGIEQIDNRSGERAIWELIQNARDLSEHAVIKITLKKDSIKFSHQGEAFNLDTLSNLIKQQSTKHEGEEVVGQYGTGFMTTHSFSRKVFISGDCRIDPENGNSVFVPLPEGFCLDRTSDQEEEFIEEMKRELSIVDNLIDDINSGHSSPCVWTTFSYPLTLDGKAEKISSQLGITMKLMPYVLVFNDRITECTIEDEIAGHHICFSKVAKRKEVLSYDDAVSIVHNSLARISQGIETPIEILTLESSNGDDRIVIPPLPLEFNDVKAIPSQFIFFPLLGTEDFGTNFIFHSKRLYPTEQRNSFLLPKDNDGLTRKFNHNKKVIDEMTSMLFAYYNSSCELQQNISIEFARINFNYEKQDDPITKEYLQKLQETFVSHFIHWKMIPTDKGFLSIHDDGGFVVLHQDIYSKLSEEAIRDFIPALVSLASKSTTLPSENIVKWSEVVYEWDPNNKGYYICLDKICSNICSKEKELKPFLLLLKELGKSGSDLLAKYKLIPNREGALRQSGDLKDAADITPELYDLVKPILGDKVQKYIDPEFAMIADLPKYTRTDLRTELMYAIEDLRKETIKRTSKYVYGGNKSLIEANQNVKLADLLNFCAAFPNENNNSARARLLPIICRIYDLDYRPSVIPSISKDEVDFYSGVFNYLIDHTLFVLSTKNSKWLKDETEGPHRLELLKEFLSEFTDTSDKDRLKKLDEYGIFPNRNLSMCLPKELKKGAADSIPHKILDLYKSLTTIVDDPIKDYRDILVDEDFEAFYEFTTCESSDITDRMETILRKKDEDFSWENTRRIVLDIIEGIDNDEWPDKDIFREIRAKKPTIFFKNAVSGEKGKHVYSLMKQDDAVIEDLAALAEDPEFAGIIGKAKDLLMAKKYEEADFEFKKKMGNHIEFLLREKLKSTLNSYAEDFTYSIDDVQNGQDIIIRYKGSIIYYIEVKTKWNFTTSGPAYMSKNQVLKACRNIGHYALCCVDLTNYDLPDRNYPETIERIEAKIKFRLDIGSILQDLMKPTLEADDKPDDSVAIDGDYKARIPAKIFRQGISLDSFIDHLLDKVNDD